jgi:hypothetical protein
VLGVEAGGSVGLWGAGPAGPPASRPTPRARWHNACIGGVGIGGTLWCRFCRPPRPAAHRTAQGGDVLHRVAADTLAHSLEGGNAGLGCPPPLRRRRGNSARRHPWWGPGHGQRGAAGCWGAHPQEGGEAVQRSSPRRRRSAAQQPPWNTQRQCKVPSLLGSIGEQWFAGVPTRYHAATQRRVAAPAGVAALQQRFVGERNPHKATMQCSTASPAISAAQRSSPHGTRGSGARRRPWRGPGHGQ